jgi:hypothetical protein
MATIDPPDFHVNSEALQMKINSVFEDLSEKLEDIFSKHFESSCPGIDAKVKLKINVIPFVCISKKLESYNGDD